MAVYTVRDFVDRFGLRKQGGEYVGPCPLCGGRDRFHVRQGRDGPAVFGCRQCIDEGQDLGGDRARSVLAMLSPEPSGEAPGRRRHTCGPLCVWYDRVDDAGRVRQHREPCRGPDCTFKGCNGADTKHLWVTPKGSRPVTHVTLYGTGEGPVTVVEGEKAARAVEAAGRRACSWLAGDKGVLYSDFSRLAGTSVVLWPDADTVGAVAMNRAAAALATVGVLEMRRVDVTDRPPKWDAADADSYLIRDLIDAAAPYEPPVDLPPTAPADSTAPSEEWGPWSCTSLGDAIRLLRKYAEQLLVVLNPDDGTAELLVDNGVGVWRRDEGRIGALIFYTAKNWESRAFDAVGGDQAVRVRRWALRSASTRGVADTLSRVSAAVTTLRDHDELPKGLTVCQVEDLDADRSAMGSPGGVVDVTTGKVLSPAEGRRTSTTKMLPDAVNLEAQHEAVDKLLGRMSDQERSWLLDALGFALRGYCGERILHWQGDSGAGKSTLADAVRVSLGPEYATKALSTAFTPTKFENRDRPEPSKFLASGGVRLMFIEEPVLGPNRSLDWPVIKELSGSKQGRARRLNQNDQPLHYTATMCFVSNDSPRLPTTGDGNAVMRRWRLLPMGAEIPDAEKDPDLRHVWERDHHARQALVAELLRRGVKNASPPADTPVIASKRTKLHEDAWGPVGLWLHAAVVVDGDSRLLTQQLYDAALEELGEDTLANWDRASLARRAITIHQMPTTANISVNGQKGPGWKGWRLATAEDRVVWAMGECSICHNQRQVRDADGKGLTCEYCQPRAPHEPPPPPQAGQAAEQFPVQRELHARINHYEQLHQAVRQVFIEKPDLRPAKEGIADLLQLAAQERILNGLRAFRKSNPDVALYGLRLEMLGGAAATVDLFERLAERIRPDTLYAVNWRRLCWDLGRLVEEEVRTSAPERRASVWEWLRGRVGPRVRLEEATEGEAQ